MNYKFYYRAKGKFVDDIKCIVISEDFKQQYRIYLDGHCDSVLKFDEFTSNNVASFIRANYWREGDIRELHLLLDENAIKEAQQFLFKHNIVNSAIHKFTEFYIIFNTYKWHENNLIALVFSNNMINQYRLYNINDKLKVDRIKKNNIFFDHERIKFINRGIWKIVSVKELADRFVEDKKALYDWLVNIEIENDLDEALYEFAESDTFDIDQPELDISADELELCKNPDMQIFCKVSDRVKEIIRSYPTSFEFAVQQNDGSISWNKIESKTQPKDLMIYKINDSAKSRQEIIGYNVITGLGINESDYYIRTDDKKRVPFHNVDLLHGYFMTEYTRHNDISGTTVCLKKEIDIKFGTPVRVFFKK